MSRHVRLTSIALVIASVASAQPQPKTPLPGDDFFTYTNREWLAKTEIPADRSGWGVFAELAAETDKRTRALIEEAAAQPGKKGSPAQKVGDYYATFMDEAAIEKLGAKPLAADLARIAKVKDKKGLAKLLGEDLRADVDALNNTEFHTTRLFGLWVAPDFHGDKNTAYLMQGGLGLPDREYYLADTAAMKETRAAYQKHIAAMLGLAGIADGETRAQRVLELETKMAKAHASRQDSLDVKKADNPWKRTEYPTRAPGLDWNVYFAAAKLGKAPVIVAWHPTATTGLAALVESEPLDAWKDWAAFQAIDRAAPLLSKAFVDQRFAFHGKALSGTPEIGERWKRGVNFTNEAVGDAVGQLYVAKYFPAAHKAQIQAMVAQITAAFEKRIDELAWMAPETRARAKEKVRSLYVGVGYPDKFTDYGKLAIVRGDALGNAQRVARFNTDRSLAKIGKAIDRTEWTMTPQTVNAVNLPLQNALNFPAAILAPPFFDPAAPASANYGAIGGVIGHEISHSFDDQGALFDAHGKLANWWTPADMTHFEQSGARLAAQFDTYQPFPDARVNGKLTLSENIADLAGLSAAYDGWRASLGGQPEPVVNGLSGEQRFFMAWAQAWRTKYREPALRRQLITNGHAPGMYRAVVMRNLDAWYAAFDVKPGQKLYLAPKDRVRVW
jgi:putative endopeptidase